MFAFPKNRYTKAMSVLHWAIGTAIVGVVGTVKLAQWTDKENKERKGRLMHVHKSLALVVAALVPVRIGIRLASRIPKHLPGLKPIEEKAGNASHLALYGFMVGMPASGIAMGYFSGYGIPFFWTKVNGSSSPDKKLAGAAYQAHSLMGKALFYFIPVHAGAAFFHAWKGRRIFGRINPWGAPKN